MLESNSMWHSLVFMIGAFAVGIAAIHYFVPELRTATGTSYVVTKQPVTTRDTAKINRLLEETPVDSDLNSLPENMDLEKIRMFENIFHMHMIDITDNL